MEHVRNDCLNEALLNTYYINIIIIVIIIVSNIVDVEQGFI